MCLFRTTEINTVWISDVCGSRMEPPAPCSILQGLRNLPVSAAPAEGEGEPSFGSEVRGSPGPRVSIHDRQALPCTGLWCSHLSPFSPHRSLLTASLHNSGRRQVGVEQRGRRSASSSASGGLLGLALDTSRRPGGSFRLVPLHQDPCWNGALVTALRCG